MTDTTPSIPALKSQAKRLRAEMAVRGQSLSHAEALETIAHLHGAKDWNTLHARAGNRHQGWAPGQRVSGRYLGHAFTGRVKAARQASSGYWALTLRFDAPVDVVASRHFSAFRQQVSGTVNAEGQSPQKTSDGQPHLVLHPD